MNRPALPVLAANATPEQAAEHAAALAAYETALIEWLATESDRVANHTGTAAELTNTITTARNEIADAFQAEQSRGLTGVTIDAFTWTQAVLAAATVRAETLATEETARAEQLATLAAQFAPAATSTVVAGNGDETTTVETAHVTGRTAAATQAARYTLPGQNTGLIIDTAPEPSDEYVFPTARVRAAASVANSMTAQPGEDLTDVESVLRALDAARGTTSRLRETASTGTVFSNARAAALTIDSFAHLGAADRIGSHNTAEQNQAVLDRSIELHSVRAALHSGRDDARSQASRAMASVAARNTRMSASVGVDRMVAGPVSCHPGVFDTTLLSCVRTDEPLGACLTVLTPIAEGGKITRYVSGGGLECAVDPLALGGIDCPDGSKSEKECYDYTPACETPVVGETCGDYVCIRVPVYSKMTWRDQIVNEFERIQAARARRNEEKRRTYAFGMSVAHGTNYTLTAAQYGSAVGWDFMTAFRSQWTRFTDAHAQRGRLRDERTWDLVLDVWFMDMLAAFIDGLVPGQSVPNWARNINSVQGIEQFLLNELPHIGKICYAIDGYSTSAADLVTKYQAKRLDCTDGPAAGTAFTVPNAYFAYAAAPTVGAYPTTPTLLAVPSRGIAELELGRLDIGFSVDGMIMGSPEAAKNVEFGFAERWWGLMPTSADDCAPAASWILPGFCIQNFAPARATAAACHYVTAA